MPLIIFQFSIKISRNKFDKEFEVSDNPVSIGKRDTESLLPVVAGGKQRLSRQPYGFFFQKEPLTCQPQIKGVIRKCALNICVSNDSGNDCIFKILWYMQRKNKSEKGFI